MSILLATALLATHAAAQLTTSMWIPGSNKADFSFKGSVVEQKDDRTTVVLEAPPALASDAAAASLPFPSTLTLGGVTYVGYAATADVFDDNNPLTVSFACQRADTKAAATCTFSTAGFAAVVSSLCADTQTDTPDDFCSGNSGAGGVMTTTMPAGKQQLLNEFPLTLTAGTEKLSAAASPTMSHASATASASGSHNVGSASASASASGSASVPHSTGAAASLQNTVPALAGMGAAVAAFFL